MEGNQDEIDAFPNAEARKRTVAQAIDAYMLDYSGRDVGLINRLAWWKSEYGAVSLAQLNQAKIKDAVRELGRENVRRGSGPGGRVHSLSRRKAPATINRYLQAISSVLAWAVDQGWIAKNAARHQASQGAQRESAMAF